MIMRSDQSNSEDRVMVGFEDVEAMREYAKARAAFRGALEARLRTDLLKEHAERSLMDAYRVARRHLTVEQAVAAIEKAEARLVRRKGHQPLTTEQLAECFRRIPGQPAVILQDVDPEFEVAFRASLDRLHRRGPKLSAQALAEIYQAAQALREAGDQE